MDSFKNGVKKFLFDLMLFEFASKFINLQSEKVRTTIKESSALTERISRKLIIGVKRIELTEDNIQKIMNDFLEKNPEVLELLKKVKSFEENYFVMPINNADEEFLTGYASACSQALDIIDKSDFSKYAKASLSFFVFDCLYAVIFSMHGFKDEIGNRNLA